MSVGVVSEFAQRALEQHGISALDRDDATIMALDRDLRIVWTNRAYGRFASQNGGGARFMDTWGAEASYLDALPDKLKDWFEARMRRVVMGGEPFEHEYQCHGPETYRRYQLRALPLADEAGLLLVHSLVVQRPYDDSAVEDPSDVLVDENGIHHMCAHCRRIRDRDGAWHWVPQWVKQMPTHTSHDLCPVCVQYYYADLMEDAD